MIAMRALIFSFLCMIGCAKQPPRELNLIPQPVQILDQLGSYEFSFSDIIVFDRSLGGAARLLKEYTGRSLLSNHSSADFIKGVQIKQNPSLNTEEYVLSIDIKGVLIEASTVDGAYRAVQTLRLLLPEDFEVKQNQNKSAYLPFIRIQDAPEFDYRGMHLDVSRHFFPVEFIKKYIDLMAMLKFNVFHWHLTDDQGWRIQIDGFPKLNSIGSFRDETLIGHYNDQPKKFDGEKYGGYYSKQNIRDIVAFAEARGVEVIPEIDIPGHSSAILASYPEYGCANYKDKVATSWGVFDAILCPKIETFKFLEDVFDEIIPLFPSQYIHIGGDEAVKTRWQNCSHCQSLIKTYALQDETGLQAYFIKKVASIVARKGKTIVGWDEILEGGLIDEATIMSWRGVDGGIAAAKAGMNAIMTPTSHCYFDYYQSENTSEPLAIGGFLPLKKVYSFNPIPDGLTNAEQGYILGGQANVWTEYISTPDAVEYMAFPRMIALSEVLWTPVNQRDFKNFANRLERFKKRLDVLNVNYANHSYEIIGRFENGSNMRRYELSTLIDDKTIRFTTDGSTPGPQSKKYIEAIPVNQNTTIKAVVVENDKTISEVFEQNIFTHLGFGKSINIAPDPHPTYNTGGEVALLNGIIGSNNRFGDSEWLGFWGDDVSIQIDLGKETDISTLSTRFFNTNGQWIYAPKYIRVTCDDDKPIVMEIKGDDSIVNVDVTIDKKTRFLKIEVVGFGIIPDQLQGGGHPAWTFIDELILQ